MEEVSGVPCLEERRLVLIGNAGSGKSACGNTILGRRQFVSKLCARAVTKKCENGSADLVEDHDQMAKRRVTVVDMPGFGDTELSVDEIHTEIAKCLSLSAPGPHAFLLVMQIGRYTDHEEQAVINLTQIFGADAVKHHTVVLFTKGDELDIGFDEYLRDAPAALKGLIDKCGGRYHVLDNKNNGNVAQVTQLLEKVDSMVKESETGFYTNALFEKAEAAIRAEKKLMMKEEKEVATGCITETKPAKQRKLELEADNGQSVTEDEESQGSVEIVADVKQSARDEECQDSRSNKDSRNLRKKAALSPRVLRLLKTIVAAGVTGLAVGIAFGIAAPLVAAGSASLVGNAVALAAVKMTGISAAGAVGIGNAVGAVAAVASGKMALAVGAGLGGTVGSLIGVAAGLEAKSPKEAALKALEDVAHVGCVALGAAAVAGAAMGAGAALSAAVGAQGAASASVGTLPAETGPICSSSAGPAVQAPPNEAAKRPILDAVTTIGKVVAAGISVATIGVKVVKSKTKDSETTTYEVNWKK
ncbi:GTPase IMAP family member 4-like isoform X2 [Syngnathoides biaculeatus]|nr:GTPase IMAP family member 4-like isoform X2 [Syngnathoides biaculeatus]